MIRVSTHANKTAHIQIEEDRDRDRDRVCAWVGAAGKKSNDANNDTGGPLPNMYTLYNIVHSEMVMCCVHGTMGRERG